MNKLERATPPEPATGLAVRVSSFYGALFVIYGMHVPFTPLWLDYRDLSPQQISMIMAAPLFLRIFATPALALHADRRHAHRATMVALAWVGLAAVCLLTQSTGFWPIAILVTVLVICNSSLMPLAETLAVRGVRAGHLDYGRVRLWGSLTFILASFCGGFVVDAAGAGAGMWLVALGCALTLAAAHLLPRLAERENDKSASFAHTPIWQAKEPRVLLASTPFLLFLIAAGGSQSAHATMLNYGTLIWQGQGINATLCGALWAIAVLAEVALFAGAGRLMTRFGAANLLIVASALSLVRWILMAFDPPLALLVPLQTLHAITYAGSHIGAICFISQAVPPAMQGSAQALYATISSGVAMGGATLLAGWLRAGHGSGAAYLAMAGIAIMALVAALALRRAWPGAELTLPTSAAPVLAQRIEA